MIYNTGEAGIKKFKNMRAAVKSKDWKKMADEMVKSKWYNQVGNRSKTHVKRVREQVGDESKTQVKRSKEEDGK